MRFLSTIGVSIFIGWAVSGVRNLLHYLLYGSEFLNALAMHLWCREKLRKVGTPTLVICDVPLEDISDVWLKDLEKDIRHRATSVRSIAVSAVAPENVVDFIYPDGWVTDPYSWRKVRLVTSSDGRV